MKRENKKIVIIGGIVASLFAGLIVSGAIGGQKKVIGGGGGGGVSMTVRGTPSDIATGMGGQPSTYNVSIGGLVVPSMAGVDTKKTGELAPSKLYQPTPYEQAMGVSFPIGTPIPKPTPFDIPREVAYPYGERYPPTTTVAPKKEPAPSPTIGIVPIAFPTLTVPMLFAKFIFGW